jgi:hypothetical protein
MSSDLLPAISRAVTFTTRLRVISEQNAALKGQMQSSSNTKGDRCPRCFVVVKGK